MSLSAIGIISALNECVTLFQWAKSAISSLHSRWSGSQEQNLQDRVLQLESGLQCLRDTLPAMYSLINKAEWRSHDDGVASLLPNLKDAVSEAEDLLDEFRWYEKKVQMEGNASQFPFIDFFDTVIPGSFNKLNDVQLRLNHLSRTIDTMGLHGVTHRFDKLVRPETTSLPNETKMFGRDKELKQRALSNLVTNKRLLIVLDDMWDDALKENEQCWKRFIAPFRSVQEGSAMLVTTRCPKVTEGVRTMEPVILEGLRDDVFWNFFKSCIFGSENSDNDPELERIGRSILPKLKGSPLAAKTLGRMLSMDLQASHWNFILESELWELRQEPTDILPALRLSYMYLPFYLKQCFAFCAVYPKDYRFEKACLAEIWAAEGFVEPQGGVPIQNIGCQYFEELVARSFFQKVNGGYVIHDLLHDMAQMVSEHHCFILRNKSDFDKIPQNVRHLYVLPSSDFDDSNLLGLCKYTKLRTLICKKSLGRKASFVLDHWCTKLPRMRVISCASVDELPESIGNWKHLRYLEICRAGLLMKRLPSTLCWLYHLQILYAKKCKLENLPDDFGKLTSLQKFESDGLTYYAGGQMTFDLEKCEEGKRISLIKKLNQFRGHLKIANGGLLSCFELKSISSPMISQGINLNEIPAVGIFLSLADITIDGCRNISSLEQFLCSDYVPAIKKIRIEHCEMLASVPTEKFGEFHFLEELAPLEHSRSLMLYHFGCVRNCQPLMTS
uniref:NB-ARC domain-containing protein n=1 Tax=Aegilops tauschii subsp. strangulata TaxID=200361 RepID=A0A453N8B3_AEGTS